MTQVKNIYIELQPKINQKMKMMSHVIYTKCVDYIIDNALNTKVKFMSAKQKLKTVKYMDRNSYKKRKDCSIRLCRELLTELDICQETKDIFNMSTKKDDLSDTLLMCYHHLK